MFKICFEDQWNGKQRFSSFNGCLASAVRFAREECRELERYFIYDNRDECVWDGVCGD